MLGFRSDNSLAVLHTAECLAVLVAIVLFGLRFSDISARARRTQRHLFRESQIDLLTGASRRSAATSYFASHLDEMPVGTVMIDVDHFKAINDRYVHPAGDRMLVEIARSLRQGMRIDDLLVRWGGEEFLILFACPNEGILESRVEGMRRHLAAIRDPEGEVGGVTASFGAVLSKPGSGRDLSFWLGHADMALYRA
ncbi:GGDEF domain-containing protein [Aestuariicoccus sp. MJ-SS9]|uniref:GGDEF domain-containing protein n=1 Tax=Aestuariicoccus sp. MJ-SS9 TaxID=3079855 RepID=UPI002912956A|nr:GGDEF domain-containing protein [Aestuariicoccus sp. MJ-SS9]MDU8912667.1 GGDEF domain-containing protein [Aestuariicoccus sp. MJ-SS9]